jgi:RNA polymerase sigma-70 factor (ECF subfamily)
MRLIGKADAVILRVPFGPQRDHKCFVLLVVLLSGFLYDPALTATSGRRIRMQSSDPSAAIRYSALQSLSDELLMAHLAHGNHDALAVIFDRYQRVVLGIAMQVLRNPHEAEDLLQSVFLELMRTAEKFDAAKGTARVWLLQCVYHRCFDRRRFLSRRGAYDPVEPDIDNLPEALRSDESQVSMLDSARLVKQALAQLTNSQRITIQLAFFEGLTMREIAEKTGETYDGVRHNYYRGLEKMRSVLGRSRDERRDGEQGGERAYARS